MSKKDHIPTMIKIAIENGIENKYINYNLGMKIEKIKINIVNLIIDYKRELLDTQKYKKMIVLRNEYFDYIRKIDLLIGEIEEKTIDELNIIIEKLEKYLYEFMKLGMETFLEKEKKSNIEKKVEKFEEEKEKNKADYQNYKNKIIELEKSRKKEIKKYFKKVINLLEKRVEHIKLSDEIKKEGINNFIKNLYLLLETNPLLHLNKKGKLFLRTKKENETKKENTMRKEIISLMKQKKTYELTLKLKEFNFLEPISKYLSNLLDMTETNQLEKYFWVDRLKKKELKNVKETILELDFLPIEKRSYYINLEIDKKIKNLFKELQEGKVELKKIIDTKAFLIVGMCELIVFFKENKEIDRNGVYLTIENLIEIYNKEIKELETKDEYYENIKEKDILEKILKFPHIESNVRKIKNISNVTYIEDTVEEYFISFLHINTLINILSKKYKDLNNNNLKTVLEIYKNINFNSLNNINDVGIYGMLKI